MQLSSRLGLPLKLSLATVVGVKRSFHSRPIATSTCSSYVESRRCIAEAINEDYERCSALNQS